MKNKTIIVTFVFSFLIGLTGVFLFTFPKSNQKSLGHTLITIALIFCIFWIYGIIQRIIQVMRKNNF